MIERGRLMLGAASTKDSAFTAESAKALATTVKNVPDRWSDLVAAFAEDEMFRHRLQALAMKARDRSEERRKAGDATAMPEIVPRRIPGWRPSSTVSILTATEL